MHARVSASEANLRLSGEGLLSSRGSGSQHTHTLKALKRPHGGVFQSSSGSKPQTFAAFPPLCLLKSIETSVTQLLQSLGDVPEAAFLLLLAGTG